MPDKQAPLDQLYKRIILEHNRTPLNRRRLSGVTHSARGHDALCGDDILVEVRVVDGRIEDSAFFGEACAVTTASASMMTEWIRNRSMAHVLARGADFRHMIRNPEVPDESEFGDLNQLRGVSGFPARVRNALLPWRTLAAALSGEREMDNLMRNNPR